jgi:dynein heavy chain, axonemal
MRAVKSVLVMAGSLKRS